MVHFQIKFIILIQDQSVCVRACVCARMRVTVCVRVCVSWTLRLGHQAFKDTFVTTRQTVINEIARCIMQLTSEL